MPEDLTPEDLPEIFSSSQPEHYTIVPTHAVDPKGRFKHVMALALNPKTNFEDGVIRCITKRDGDVTVSGYVDYSELHRVTKVDEYQFEIGERLHIQDEDEIISSLLPEGFEFIGLEDPDLVSVEGTLHLYFTIPLLNRGEGRTLIYLGHAEGASLDTLKMTPPVLTMDESGAGAKEVALVPPASDGVARHLVESSAPGTEFSSYSTLRLAPAKSFTGSWEFGDTIFHPAEENIRWAGGHASPGPFLPRKFIDVGEHRLLGFMNGREADSVVREQVVFGAFTIGLYIYDYEHGTLDWVSPETFIKDPDALTITFASQFVQTGPKDGVLYAHVDDSFVRAYLINADKLRSLIESHLLTK